MDPFPHPAGSPASSPADGSAWRTRTIRIGLAALAVALLAVYGWRLTLGVDFSDESYYAVGPVSWLRSSPAATGNLSIHQMSGVLTYPVVRLHAWVRPDLKGLMLTLRAAYAALALGMALVTYSCLRRLVPPLAAAGCASIVVTFVPFGLPAPSYNTLGMLGIVGGVMALARALAAPAEGDAPSGPTWPWLALAGGLLAVGTVAYPTLVVLPPLAGVLLTAACPRRWPAVAAALGVWAAAFALLLGAAAALLGGPGRLGEMFEFSFLLNAQAGWADKAAAAWLLLEGSPAFLVLAALVLAAGLLGRWSGHPAGAVAALAAGAGLAAWWVVQSRPAVCFGRGHDLVLLLALAGLPAFVGRGRLAGPRRRILAALYVLGLAGGGLTAWTASNTLFNFCLLGVLAALAGLAAWADAASDSGAGSAGDAGDAGDATGAGRAWPAAAALAATLTAALAVALVSVLLGVTSLTFVYGETVPPAALTARVREGPFAGLRTVADKAALVRELRREVVRHGSTCRTVEVLGHLPGLYLLTSLQLRTPMPYMIQDYAAGPVRGHLARFYEPPGGPADLVLLIDTPGRVLNRVQSGLVRDCYEPVGRRDPVTLCRYRGRAGPLAPPSKPASRPAPSS